MNNEFVPYDIALALKELGFDEPCFGYFRDSDGELFPHSYYENKFPDELTLAPLLQQAFRWFREKDMDFRVGYARNMSGDKYYFAIVGAWTHDKDMTNYEEAELEVLKKLIEIVKDK